MDHLPVPEMVAHLLTEYYRSELDEIIAGIQSGRGGTRVREPRDPLPDPSGLSVMTEIPKSGTVTADDPRFTRDLD